MAEKQRFRRKSAQKKKHSKKDRVTGSIPTEAFVSSASPQNTVDVVSPTQTSSPLPLAVPTEQMMETIEKTIKDTVEQRTKDIQIQYIEVLGIFVTLFTFVSLNFQIFNQIDSLNYAVFIIVLIFLCLFGFIYLLHNILEKKGSTWQIIVVVLIALFILWTSPNIQLRPIDPFRSKIDERIKQLESKVEQLEWKMKTTFPGWWGGGK